MDKISINAEKNEVGEYKSVEVRFGPHFMAKVNVNNGKTTFSLIATHHGFKADASKLDGELEQIIEKIRENHLGNAVD